uniref:Uncharacterized protein n=1 Tax=Rhizophora mucronata TaxID=61149 RepID=A0A2P2QBV1_RHIMU
MRLRFPRSHFSLCLFMSFFFPI